MKDYPYEDNLVVDCYFLEGYYPHYENGKLATNGDSPMIDTIER